MSAYLYPSTSAHRAPLFFEDNDLFQAFGGGCRRSYEDPFSHAIRLAQVEEEAREQRVVAKARARAQAEAQAEARRLYQLRLEQEQHRRRQQILHQQQVARAQVERQRRAELAAAREEADFIEALQQHIFGGAQRQAAIERQRALELQEQQRQAEIAHQQKLQARRRQEQEEAQRQQAFAIEDVFGPQFFEQTFENFLAPFLGSLMQQEPNDEEETVAAPATAAGKGKAVDRSTAAEEAEVPTPKAASIESTQVPAQDATNHETVRSIPIDSVKKVPSPPASDAGSTRGRSRSPKRARVSDVDEEGNEIATDAQEQEEEDYVRLSEAGSEH